MENKEYYLVSLVHTKKTDSFITLWKGSERGYTFTRARAGIYSHLKPEHDNADVMPVLRSKLESLFIESGQDKGVPNCKAVLEELGLRWSATGLRRSAKSLIER